jgi:hypothetical protein
MSDARVLTVDFTKTPDHRQHKSGKPQDQLPTGQRPLSADGKLLTPKQIRARARRKAARGNLMTTQEQEIIFTKPIDEWDLEELSRGRPRATDGTFRGPKPRWITREVHEQSMDLFKAALKTEMNYTTVTAMDVLRATIQNEEVDDKGKPLVPASTKVDAAKFLIEHVVGKPKQHIDADVSVKLQGILATVMGNPAQTLMSPETGGQGYTLGHFPGVTIPFGIQEGGEDEDDEPRGE